MTDLSLAEVEGGELPPLAGVERGDVGTAGDVHVLVPPKDILERTLDPIEDGVHDTRTKLQGQRLALAEHGVAHRQAGRVLVHLEQGEREGGYGEGRGVRSGRRG